MSKFGITERKKKKNRRLSRKHILIFFAIGQYKFLLTLHSFTEFLYFCPQHNAIYSNSTMF